jgi:hypothetical protein
MINQFEKKEKLCNNVYLIDERICLKDSIEIINSNFISLSSAYNNLLIFANKYNNLYTIFSKNSSDWQNGSINANSSKQNYNNAYSTVRDLSASWVKEFAIIYPKIIDIDVWNANLQNYKNTIKDWLTLKFPIDNFGIDQLIFVYVNLYKKESFSFNFSGSYDEKCETPPSNQSVTCNGNNIKADHGCNHTSGKGKDKHHYCDNAFDKCGSNATVNTAYTYCKGGGSKLLKMTAISQEYTDTYTARSILLKYKKNNTQTLWINYE